VRIGARDPRPESAAATEMTVSFLGLTGPQGVLPPHYTALVLQRIKTKDFVFRDFLDLFNHRVVSLFYRAWEKYRLPFSYERASLEGEEVDPITTILYCLVGLGTEGLRGRLSVPDESFLFYGGHFAHYPRSASALEAMLRDYFGLPIKVNQAHGQWLTLEADDRSLMPGPGNSEPQNCQLGVNVIAGERVWDVQSKFRIQMGPVNYEQFCRYLPGGPGLRALAELTRSYVGPEYDFDVVVLLLPEEVPWCQFQSDGSYQPRLGWNTWVRCREMREVVDDAVFDLSEA
jgi:type VI secretion system protein ImpH